MTSTFDVEPTYKKGNLQKYYKWLFQTVEYPTELRMNRVEGTVNIRIVIDTDGTVLAGDVLSSPHEEFSDAVAKAIERSSKWKPAMLRNEGGELVPVKVLYTIPVKFTLPPESVEDVIDVESGRFREDPDFKPYGAR
jgi:protein TonB